MNTDDDVLKSKDEGENDHHSYNQAGRCLMTDHTLLWKLSPDRDDYGKPADQFWSSRIRAFINI